MSDINKADLDNWITGHWGEDQFKDDDRAREREQEEADDLDWEARVQALENEGLTRSDAQAVVDAEDVKAGRPRR